LLIVINKPNKLNMLIYELPCTYVLVMHDSLRSWERGMAKEATRRAGEAILDQLQPLVVEHQLSRKQQIMGNGVAFLHVLLPAAYGPHNKAQFSILGDTVPDMYPPNILSSPHSIAVLLS
jgi:hypothetical protein